MATPKPKVTRIVIDDTGVRKLLKHYITEDIMDIAAKLLPEISKFYTYEDGSNPQWNLKFSLNKRVKRMYGVIYCMDESIKYKEAKHGLIAKHLKSLTVKGKINVHYQGDGIIIG